MNFYTLCVSGRRLRTKPLVTKPGHSGGCPEPIEAGKHGIPILESLSIVQSAVIAFSMSPGSNAIADLIHRFETIHLLNRETGLHIVLC